MDGYSGWGASSSDGGAAKAVSGAPIKAIKMSLSGQLAANYDIWYRVCDSGNGWTGWASNGQACGVSGGSSGLCGIDVALVNKGQSSPGSSANAFIETPGIGLVSQAHVASAGWLAPVGNGETAGQTGKSRSLQALYVATQASMPQLKCRHMLRISAGSHTSRVLPMLALLARASQFRRSN